MTLHRLVVGGTESTIALNDHKVSYITVGEGDTILFVHGAMASKMMWYPMILRMVKKYHIVDIDLPGYGDSSKNDTSDYSIKVQVKRLEQIVDQLGLKRFHLAGSSMGGAISVNYTLNNPERIKSLALFDPAGIYSADTSDYLKLVLKGEDILILKNKKDIERVFEYLFYNPPKIAKLLNVHVLIGENNLQYHKFYKRVMDDLYIEKYSFESDLDKISVKTVIFWGDHDRILDKSCAYVINDRIKNSELNIIENCGHLPMIEKAKETTELYINFLDQFKNK